MSLTHSSISSILCLYCYLNNPNLLSHPLEGHDTPTRMLVAFSWGYFLHDLVHTLICRKIKNSWDILIHHLVVLACHGLSLHQDMYINFSCVSLFCEANSVFLHWRQLLKMSSCPDDRFQFRLVKVMNILTFLAVRIPSLGYLSVTVLKVKEAVHWLPFYTGLIGGVIMNVVNVILLYRLLKADVFSSKVRKVDWEGTAHF